VHTIYKESTEVVMLPSKDHWKYYLEIHRLGTVATTMTTFTVTGHIKWGWMQKS